MANFIKFIFLITIILTLFSLNIFAKCEGTDSHYIDSFIENFERIEKYKKEKPHVNKDDYYGVAHVGGISISGSDQSDHPINLDALLDWNVGFSEGLAKIIVNGKSGFINYKGKIVIKPQYKLVSCFSNGLATVKISKKWGFINSKNQLVIPAKFDAVDNFSEGLALVKVGKLWGFINTKGKFIIPPKFEQAGSFSEGLASISFYDKKYVWTNSNLKNGKWVSNFIDKTGKVKFSKNFDGNYGSFNNGKAIISRNLGYSEKFKGIISERYIIDSNGNELWKLDSWYITRFSEDMIVVAISKDEKTKRDKYTLCAT